MFVILSLVAAIFPMFFYLILIWKLDRYDREPFKFVLTNFMWGALGAIFLSIIGSTILTIILSLFIKDNTLLNYYSTVYVAPFVEEITKGSFLLITVSSKKFDNLTDGIVYGGAIGLGFGMTENFFYFISNSETLAGWLMLVIIRSLFTAVMHCISTSTLGAFLALSKFKPSFYKLIYPVVGVIIAILIHSFWNFSVSTSENAYKGFVFMIGAIVIFILIYSLSLRNERKTILKELMEESELGLIPKQHLAILSSPLREKKGWLDESIRKTYIRAATTLAFRKVQMNNSSGMSKNFYESDVYNYRTFITKLLSESKII